jgi:hypothetical protein
VEFFAAGASAARSKCGDLPFDEDTLESGLVIVRQAIEDTLVDQWQSWGRRLRDAASGEAPEYFLNTSRARDVDTFGLAAPARDQYDLIYLAWRHNSDSTAVLDTMTEVNAGAQL